MNSLMSRLGHLKAKDISKVVQLVQSKHMKDTFIECEQHFVESIDSCWNYIKECIDDQVIITGQRWQGIMSPLDGHWMW